MNGFVILLFIIVLPQAGFLVYLYFREQEARSKCLYYSKQGFCTFFSFLKGIRALATPYGRDSLAPLRDACRKVPEDAPGIVVADAWQKCAHLIITDRHVANEFLMTEHDFAVRSLQDKVPWKSSFGFLSKLENGRHPAFAVMKECFGSDGANKYFEKLRELAIDASVMFLETSTKLKPGSDMKFVVENMVCSIFQSLFFGEYSKSLRVHNGVMPVVDAMLYIGQIGLDSRGLYSNANQLSVGWATSLGLVSGTSQAGTLYNECQMILDQFVSKKLESGYSTDDVFDIFLQRFWNLQEEYDEDTPKDVSAFLMDLVTLGVAPTAGFLTNLLFMLSKEPSIQQAIREELLNGGVLPKNISVEHLNNLPVLDTYLKTCYMKYNPMQCTWQRLIYKDVTIGKYEFNPGDRVTIPTFDSLTEKPTEDTSNSQNLGSGPYQEESEPLNESNDTDRNKKIQTTSHPKLSPMKLCPFSSGQRACPSQDFANNIIKLLIINIVLWSNMSPSTENDIRFESMPMFVCGSLPVNVNVLFN